MGFVNTSPAPGLAYDQPVTLFNQGGFAFGTNLFPVIDIGQLQSIVVLFNKTNNVNHNVNVQLSWLDAAVLGNTVAQDLYKWAAADLNTPLNVALPVRARFLQIRLTLGAAGTNDNMTVIGSNRPFTWWSQNLGNRVLATESFGAGPLATATFPGVGEIWPRYDGNLLIGFTGTYPAGQPAVVCSIAINDLDTGLSLLFNTGAQVINNVPKMQAGLRAYPVPRNSWTISVFNGSAANTLTFQMELIMVPEVGYST